MGGWQQTLEVNGLLLKACPRMKQISSPPMIFTPQPHISTMQPSMYQLELPKTQNSLALSVIRNTPPEALLF